MTTGIIYLAKNTISKKCYVGQTIRTLEQRKKEHLWHTIKADYKFGRALQKYPLDSWEWSVLAEVPIEELDECEIFFIEDLDTFNNGYNTLISNNWKGAGNPRKNYVTYELWHPQHGTVEENINELCKRSTSFGHIHELLRGVRLHIAGFVLPENKDKYDSIVKNYDFYHPDYGAITCTTMELFRQYPDHFKKECNIYNLTARKVKVCAGWCLAENKENYKDLADISGYVTLSHSEHGTLTLKKSEFKKNYGLTDSGISYLISGRNKSTRGWTLPTTQTQEEN